MRSRKGADGTAPAWSWSTRKGVVVVLAKGRRELVVARAPNVRGRRLAAVGCIKTWGGWHDGYGCCPSAEDTSENGTAVPNFQDHTRTPTQHVYPHACEKDMDPATSTGTSSGHAASNQCHSQPYRPRSLKASAGTAYSLPVRRKPYRPTLENMTRSCRGYLFFVWMDRLT